MLTGRRQFDGKTVSHVLASVLESDPNWVALSGGLPQPVVRLLRRCLEKDPKRRLRDIGEAVLQLEDMAVDATLDAPSSTEVAQSALSLSQRLTPALVALIVGSIVTGVTVWSLRSRGTREVTRMAVPLQTGIPPPSESIAFSHDGRSIAYVDQRGGPLYWRSLDQLDATPMPGTDGAVSVSFSPDDAWLVFADERALKKVALAGGPPMTLVEWSVTAGFGGATWGVNDTIVYARARDGLFSVSALGGQPERLTTVDLEEEVAHVSPRFLPDGESLLFTVFAGGGGQVTVLPRNEGDPRALLVGTKPRYVRGGHLLFSRASSLWRVGFDDSSLEVVGEPFPVLEGVSNDGNSNPRYAVSDGGSIAYSPGTVTPTPQRTLVWIDRDGNEEELAAPPRAYIYPRISPDGSQVAVEDFCQCRRCRHLGVGLCP